MAPAMLALALVSALAVGLAFVSCGDEESGAGGDNGGGSVTRSTFTLAGIPSQYNGKYVVLSARKTDWTYQVAGVQSYSKRPSTAASVTLTRISNGSASIPLKYIPDSDPTADGSGVRAYTGNDTVDVRITIHDSSGYSLANIPTGIANRSFSSVKFSNGGATRSW